jgi:hypothetical protein
MASLRRGNCLNRRRRAQNTHCAPTGPHQHPFSSFTRSVFCFHRDTGAQPTPHTSWRRALSRLTKPILIPESAGSDASPRRRNCRCRVVDGGFRTRHPPGGFISLCRAVPTQKHIFVDEFVRFRLRLKLRLVLRRGWRLRWMRWELNHERSFRARLAA